MLAAENQMEKLNEFPDAMKTQPEGWPPGDKEAVQGVTELLCHVQCTFLHVPEGETFPSIVLVINVLKEKEEVIVLFWWP